VAGIAVSIGLSPVERELYTKSFARGTSEEKIEEYITFYNDTARPMKWKYDGKKKIKNMKTIWETL